MSSYPSISIITVTFNASKCIEKTIKSVLAQSFQDWEYIIIDGGSKDGTVDIIKQYADRLTYWVSEPDKGIYDAMNKGIAHASGELIGIVNAGDYYEPDTLSIVAEAYRMHPNAGIFHGILNYRNIDGTLFKTKIPDSDVSHLCSAFRMHHPTFFVTKTTYASIGAYDTTYRITADYDFALRAYFKGIEFYYINEVLSNFILDGISSTNRKATLKESKRALLKNGISEKEAEQTYLQWLRKEKKNNFYRKGYDFLKTLVPLAILNRIAKYFKV